MHVLSPLLGLIFKAQFISKNFFSSSHCTQCILPLSKLHIPAQTRCGKILTITLAYPLALSVHKQFHRWTVRVNQDLFFFIGISPSHRPTMPIDMNHRLFCPIGLEYVITFLFRKVTFHHSFLIHIWYRIIRTHRCGKVLKRPISSAGQPRHILLFLQMPIYQLNDITFRPVSFLQHQSRTVQSCIAITFTFFSYRSSSLRMTSGMAITPHSTCRKCFTFSISSLDIC